MVRVSNRTWRRSLITALAVLGALALTAVSWAASSPGAVKAAGELAPLLKPATSIGNYTPLKKKPATGKKIYFLQCSQPVCGAFIGGLQAAVKPLGWTVSGHPFTQTPEGIQSAVQAAVDAKPDAIFFTGISPTFIPKQLAQAKAAGIPVVDGFDVAQPKGALITMVGGSATNARVAKSTADYVIADSKGTANIIIFNIPAYTILQQGTTAFQAEIKRLCPGCKVQVINQQVTDVGTKIPAAAVSALQRDPKVNYLAFAFGDMPLGVYSALKAAGLEKQAKLVSFGSASPTNLGDIQKGKFSNASAWSIPFNSWQAVDAFARYFNGQPIANPTPSLQSMAINSVNVSGQYKGDTQWDFAGPANYQAKFKKLWLVP